MPLEFGAKRRDVDGGLVRAVEPQHRGDGVHSVCLPPTVSFALRESSDERREVDAREWLARRVPHPTLITVMEPEAPSLHDEDAEAIGRASVLLGAGRRKADDPIDFAVGFSGMKKVGEHVDLEEPLFVIHARNERSIVNITPLLEKAVEIA